MTRYTAAYAAEISAFIDALDNGTPMAPSAEDGLIALALADAAVKSARDKSAVTVAY